jgi:hypothetical protein
VRPRERLSAAEQAQLEAARRDAAARDAEAAAAKAVAGAAAAVGAAAALSRGGSDPVAQPTAGDFGLEFENDDRNSQGGSEDAAWGASHGGVSRSFLSSAASVESGSSRSLAGRFRVVKRLVGAAQRLRGRGDAGSIGADVDATTGRGDYREVYEDEASGLMEAGDEKPTEHGSSDTAKTGKAGFAAGQDSDDGAAVAPSPPSPNAIAAETATRRFGQGRRLSLFGSRSSPAAADGQLPAANSGSNRRSSKLTDEPLSPGVDLAALLLAEHDKAEKLLASMAAGRRAHAQNSTSENDEDGIYVGGDDYGFEGSN